MLSCMGEGTEEEADSSNERDKTIRGKRMNVFGRVKSIDLNDYREVEDDFGGSGFESDDIDMVKSLRKRRGALRFASESWDSDFEFQLSSTSSLCLPLQTSTNAPRLLRNLSNSTTSTHSSSPKSRLDLKGKGKGIKVGGNEKERKGKMALPLQVSNNSTAVSSRDLSISREENDDTTTGESTTEGEFSDLDDSIISARLHRRPLNLDDFTPNSSFAGSTVSNKTIGSWDRWKRNGSQVSFVDQSEKGHENVEDMRLEVEKDLGTVRRAGSNKLRRKRNDEGILGGESGLDSEEFTTYTQSSSNQQVTAIKGNPLLKKSDSTIRVGIDTKKKTKRLSLTHLLSKSTSALPQISSSIIPLSPTVPDSKKYLPPFASVTRLPKSDSFMSRTRLFPKTKTASVSQSQSSRGDENSNISRNLPPPLPFSYPSILRSLPSSTSSPLLFNRTQPKPKSTALSHDSNFTSSRPTTSSKQHSSGPTRPKWTTHKPSFSLSSLGLDLFSSSSSGSLNARNPPRPQTVFVRPVSFYFGEDDLVLTSEGQKMRRNSLSDLRIPSRITSSQARIEEDLERVKEFAKGIDDLKRLRQQYFTLLKLSSTPPSSPLPIANLESTTSTVNPSAPVPSPPVEAVQRMTQAIKRLKTDYHAWWEQVDALVNLGDGRSTAKEKKESPALSSSKRDRCTSLAPPESPTRLIGIANGEDTETEELMLGRTNQVVTRKASNSSVETGYSIEVRQKEMLRGLLSKASTLPVRSSPSSRPPLSIIAPALNQLPTTPTNNLTPSSLLQSPNSPTIKKKVGGILGIKDFLLRLKSKTNLNTPDGNSNPPSSSSSISHNQFLSPPIASLNASLNRRSVSNPIPRPSTPPRSTFRSHQSHSHSRSNSEVEPITPTSRNGNTPTCRSRISPMIGIDQESRRKERNETSSSSSEEDWDSSPPRILMDQLVVEDSPTRLKGLVVRRSMTVDEISEEVGGSLRGRRRRGGERMVLTTRAMPELILKVREVHMRCEECIHRLKGITI